MRGLFPALFPESRKGSDRLPLHFVCVSGASPLRSFSLSLSCLLFLLFATRPSRHHLLQRAHRLSLSLHPSFPPSLSVSRRRCSECDAAAAAAAIEACRQAARSGAEQSGAGGPTPSRCSLPGPHRQRLNQACLALQKCQPSPPSLPSRATKQKPLCAKRGGRTQPEKGRRRGRGRHIPSTARALWQQARGVRISPLSLPLSSTLSS